MGTFVPSDTARVLLVDPNGIPYAIGVGALGTFIPSDTARVLLCDEDGIPYKAVTAVGGPTIQVNGVDTTDQTVINIINGTNTSVSNPADGEIRIDSSGSAGGVAITTGQDSVAQGDTTHVITHNLNDANAILLSAMCNWNASMPYIIAQDANTITVEFPNECPLAANGNLMWAVEGGASITLTLGIDVIANGDDTHIITHNLGNASLNLVAATTNWNAGMPYIIAQDANTITIAFPNECSISTGKLEWAVA